MKAVFRHRSVILALTLACLLVFSVAAPAFAGVVNGKIVVNGDKETGYAPNSEDSSNTYLLDGPVTSGDRTVTDAAQDAGTSTNTDGLSIDKTATYDDASNSVKVSLDVTAHPIEFAYKPPPTLDYVFVLDITSSMLQPLRDTNSTDISRWYQMWHEKTRIYKMREAVKAAAQKIWASNPDSSITIVPFAADAMIPRSSHDGFNYGSGIGSLYNLNVGNATPSQTWLDGVHMPSDPDLKTMTNFTVLANNKTLTGKYDYYKVTDPASSGYTLQKFYDSIDALPVISDTNTNAGMTAALNLFKTAGFATQTDIHNRITMLITDGGANVPSGSSQENSYRTQQQAVADTCTAIKDPAQGNSTVNVVSIDPAPIGFNSSGIVIGNTLSTLFYNDDGSITNNAGIPNERVLDLQAGMRDLWATSPAHYYGSSTEAITGVIANAVRNTIDLWVGSHVTLTDTVNTQYFDVDTSTLAGTITVDGTSYSLGDADCPVKASDITFQDGKLTVDLKKMPFGVMLNEHSVSSIKFTYEMTPKADLGAHPKNIHTNVDDETFLTVTLPDHNVAATSEVAYADNAFHMPFPTPTVTLKDDTDAPELHLKKVDEAGKSLDGALFTVSNGSGDVLGMAPLSGSDEKVVLEPNMTYTFTETAAPAKYKELSGAIQVTTDGSGVPTLSDPTGKAKLTFDPQTLATDGATLTVANEPDAIEPQDVEVPLHLVKVDEEGEEIEGAVFSLLPSNSVVPTILTPEPGKDTVVTLSTDTTYTLTETEPADWCMPLEDPITISFDANGQPVIDDPNEQTTLDFDQATLTTEGATLTVENYYEDMWGVLFLRKVDEKGTRIAGSEFDVTYNNDPEDSGTLEPAVENDVGLGVDPGDTLTFAETKAPSGYVKLTQPITVSFDENGKPSLNDPTKMAKLTKADAIFTENGYVLTIANKKPSPSGGGGGGGTKTLLAPLTGDNLPYSLLVLFMAGALVAGSLAFGSNKKRKPDTK